MKCYTLKTIILGDSGVGKTTLLYKYCSGKFNVRNQSTVGVNFVSKYVKNNYNNFKDSIKLQIWDTAGQERFRSIIRSYYHNVCGCFIVYDTTNRNTFDSSLYWINEVRKTNDDAVLILVGTKIDLEDKRQVTYEEGYNISKNHNLPFFEISSKKCVDIIFNKMIEFIIEKIIENNEINDMKGVRNTVHLLDKSEKYSYFNRSSYTNNLRCCNR